MSKYIICSHDWNEKFPCAELESSGQDYETIVEEFIEEHEVQVAHYPDEWTVFIKGEKDKTPRKFIVSVDCIRTFSVEEEA